MAIQKRNPVKWNRTIRGCICQLSCDSFFKPEKWTFDNSSSSRSEIIFFFEIRTKKEEEEKEDEDDEAKDEGRAWKTSG